MIKVTTWFENYCLSVSVYLEVKNTACMSGHLWYILLLVVRETAGIAAIFCKYLQGHGTLLCNQHHTLKRLVLNINSKVRIVSKLSEVHRGAIDE